MSRLGTNSTKIYMLQDKGICRTKDGSYIHSGADILQHHNEASMLDAYADLYRRALGPVQVGVASCA